MKLPTLGSKMPILPGYSAPLAPKVAEPLYRSPEFATWRRAVLQRAGGQCQHPGCGERRRLYADHIVEVKDGGARFDPANGQALCAAHHNRKTAIERTKRLR